EAVLGAVLAALRVPWLVEPASEPFLHPGRGARVLASGVPVGWLGEVHPLVAAQWELGDVAAFEVDLDAVVSRAVAVPQYEDLTSFPALRQDIAVIIGDDVPAARVVAVVRDAGGERLRDAHGVHVYHGQRVGQR